MRRTVSLVLPSLALVLLALAAGGCGSNGEKSKVTPTAEATGTAEATVTPQATETAATDLTPRATATVITTPVPGARLAVMPQDVQAFLAQFGDNVPTPEDCDYDNKTVLVDCTKAGHGKFQVAPQPPDNVVSCSAGILDDKVVWIRCLTELSTFIYEVAAE